MTVKDFRSNNRHIATYIIYPYRTEHLVELCNVDTRYGKSKKIGQYIAFENGKKYVDSDKDFLIEEYTDSKEKSYACVIGDFDFCKKILREEFGIIVVENFFTRFKEYFGKEVNYKKKL